MTSEGTAGRHWLMFKPCAGFELQDMRMQKTRQGEEIFRLALLQKLNAKLSLCLTNQALLHEAIWASGCTDPSFLDLGISWRWVVNFMPLPFYPRGKRIHYPLDRRLCGSQSRSGLHEEKKILVSTGTRTPTTRSSSQYSVALLTVLPRLTFLYCFFFQKCMVTYNKLFSCTML
jgi:hypothetical protein